MLINTKLLSLALSAHSILADGVLIVPRTIIRSVRRHHILLICSFINVDRSLLNSALLESLGLLLQSLRVLLVRLDQLYLFLRTFVVLLILLVLKSDLLVCQALRVRRLQTGRRHLIKIPHKILLRHLQIIGTSCVLRRIRLDMHYVLRCSAVAKIKLILLHALPSRFQYKLILCVDQIRIVLWLHATVVRNLILKANLCLVTLRNVRITRHTCCSKAIIQIFGTLIADTVSKTLELVLNLRDWVFCCVREVTDDCTVSNVHCLVSNLQTWFYVRPSLRFLDVTADCVVLGESWRLSAVGSVTTFPEILQLSVIALAGTNLLLYVTLRVINSPVRVVMIVACAATHLIWTIPLVPRSTHPLQIIVRYVRCFLLVIISSDTDAIYMLGLSFANNCANWLRHVVRTHRWILLPSCSIILIEIHLIHITDAVVLSHLVLWRHWHCCILVWSIRRLVHHLHLLITEVAHFIVMHCWVK